MSQTISWVPTDLIILARTGVSIQPYTGILTTNSWLTTTGSDSSTTIVPVILPCPTCEPEIVWNTPEIPDVEFSWPEEPHLPSFHLPCIKIFGIVIAGECPSPSGPVPVNDGPPAEPEASGPQSGSPSSGTTSSPGTSTSTSSTSACSFTPPPFSTPGTSTVTISVAPDYPTQTQSSNESPTALCNASPSFALTSAPFASSVFSTDRVL